MHKCRSQWEFIPACHCLDTLHPTIKYKLQFTTCIDQYMQELSWVWQSGGINHVLWKNVKGMSTQDHLARTNSRKTKRPATKAAPAKAAPAINWRKWCCQHGNQHFGSKIWFIALIFSFLPLGTFPEPFRNLPPPESNALQTLRSPCSEPFSEPSRNAAQRVQNLPTHPTHRDLTDMPETSSIWRDARSTNRKNRDWWDEGIAEMDKIGDAGWDSAKKRKQTSSSSSSSSSSWKLCCSVLVVQHLHSFHCPSSRPQATRRPVAICTFQQKLSRKIILRFLCHNIGCKVDGL